MGLRVQPAVGCFPELCFLSLYFTLLSLADPYGNYLVQITFLSF